MEFSSSLSSKGNHFNNVEGIMEALTTELRRMPEERCELEWEFELTLKGEFYSLSSY